MKRGFGRQDMGIEMRSPKKLSQGVKALFMVGTMLFFLTFLSQLAVAQSLWDFGYGRMKTNGREALGNRPLMVLIANFAGGAPFAHDITEYDLLVFDYRQQSVNGYFWENSNARFLWSRGGTYSVSLPAD